MAEDYSKSETISPRLLATIAFSERDLAPGVTRWMVSNFQPELADAVGSTPFTVPLLCAIAWREAGMYWSFPARRSGSASMCLGMRSLRERHRPATLFASSRSAASMTGEDYSRPAASCHAGATKAAECRRAIEAQRPGRAQGRRASLALKRRQGMQLNTRLNRNYSRIA
jgi:hypothetical protein